MKKRSGNILRLTLIIFFVFLVVSWAFDNLTIPFVGLTGAQSIRAIRGFNDDIYVSGTGSMYPTFPKGKGTDDRERASETVAWPQMRRYPDGIIFAGKRYFGHSIERGDIVAFSNEVTRVHTREKYGDEAGLIKRVIGVAGDRIEIRDGFVILNGSRFKEPYVARSRSTFGGTTIPDCREIRVPDGGLFVLGDNRTGSFDSRFELGLININDVDHVLPYKDQTPFSSGWHNPASDDSTIAQPTLNSDKYEKILNQKRKEAGLAPLKHDDRLATSAKLRGLNILEYNDFSFEATRSGFTMIKAMSQAGYSNIIWGETPNTGYYTEEELIENSFQFPETRKFLLKKDFQDIGVSAVIGEINGCPTQIVVQHFGGYVPPNYATDVVESWKNALANIREVKPTWERLKTFPSFYEKNKIQIDRINEILDYRMSNMEKVVNRMEKNEWLTPDERAYVDSDKSQYEEQDRLAKQINSL